MQIYSVRLAKEKGPDYRGFVLVSKTFFFNVFVSKKKSFKILLKSHFEGSQNKKINCF